MRPDEFQSQMNRLITQFGKTQYSDERTKLIWREVKDFSSPWWERTVDHLLLTSRQAPLQAEFGELIGRERERVWRQEKVQNEKDAKDFFAGTYQPDDVQTICQMITKRLAGGVSDADYANFVKHLESAGGVN